ncbi:MAG: Vi polysaccharide biosynthesis protein VipB/TviC [Omnitrophica bacterium RBG_13_46_9]|nr:MAG: Vi polysaccharide biosynthesis protein VipB/TviC [Omnitrophica bacterium RBG_13_46_9]
MSKYLVTGGAGFIGSSIAERLVKDGQEVVVLDNLCEGKIGNISSILDKIVFIKGDIRNESDLDKALQGVDFVLHQAALRSVPKSMENPLEYNDVNVVGTLKVLMNAKRHRVKKVVFASSSSVYGERDKFPEMEEDAVNPISPYAATKLMGEYYCRLFSISYGLETVSLRYFNVFGPKQSLENQYAVVIPKFITCILHDENPPIHGDGLQERDFTFVDNVVAANIKAATIKGLSGQAVNVACGRAVSILSIVDSVNKILGKDIKPVFTPKRPGDVRKSLADIARLKANLGMENLVQFEAGLERTIEWFRQSP